MINVAELTPNIRRALCEMKDIESLTVETQNFHLSQLEPDEVWDLYLRYNGIIGMSTTLHVSHETIFKSV